MMNEDQPDLEVTLSPLFWLLHGAGHTWLSTFYIHLHQQLGLRPQSGGAQILVIFLVLNSLVLPYLGNIDNGLGGVGRGTLAKRVSLPQREIKLWQVTKKSPFVPLLSTLRGKKKKLNFDSDT